MKRKAGSSHCLLPRINRRCPPRDAVARLLSEEVMEELQFVPTDVVHMILEYAIMPICVQIFMELMQFVALELRTSTFLGTSVFDIHGKVYTLSCTIRRHILVTDLSAPTFSALELAEAADVILGPSNRRPELWQATIAATHRLDVPPLRYRSASSIASFQDLILVAHRTSLDGCCLASFLAGCLWGTEAVVWVQYMLMWLDTYRQGRPQQDDYRALVAGLQGARYLPHLEMDQLNSHQPLEPHRLSPINAVPVSRGSSRAEHLELPP